MVSPSRPLGGVAIISDSDGEVPPSRLTGVPPTQNRGTLSSLMGGTLSSLMGYPIQANIEYLHLGQWGLVSWYPLLGWMGVDGEVKSEIKGVVEGCLKMYQAKSGENQVPWEGVGFLK